MRHISENKSFISIGLIKSKVFAAFLFSCLFAIQSACATNKTIHSTEARDFCEAHNPERWEKYWREGGAESTESYYQQLASEIKSSIKTDEFRRIFKDQLEIPPDEYRKQYPNDYVYYKEKISALLGEEWDCEYLKYHYVYELKEE
ncbi:hypothetical protein EUZ85_17710 [Hahella sp. KA22]|uniref:hypothetical protein n=1 Tax=Hahella sp. KA22 TaxID=1628392 RepID=UPI000FDEB08C|nr:hypothetical protein [Hahella sp. KA22]AZZ92456.1 hypothetical protein ENC22_15135 [Hahella sp. KA22]QAY55830.1 hypothetical protein EUZ85_17710 [Hahella sp. KA22]